MTLAQIIASMDTWGGVGNVPIDQVREWRTMLATIRREALMARAMAKLAEMHGHECPPSCEIKAILDEYHGWTP